MTTQAPSALDPSTVALRLGMCAAALAGTAATVGDANAAIVTFNTTITVPATPGGVYINLLSGATGTSAATTSGWDFNPYLANGGSQLGFYWQTTAGGVGSTAGTGPYLSLAAGTSISSSSTFTRAIIGTTGSPFLTTGTHVLGFQFFNELSGATNYGYMTMTNTAATGFPTVITGWRFDNAGGAVTVVPEPSTGAMLSVGALALGALNLRNLRRQRRRQQAH